MDRMAVKMLGDQMFGPVRPWLYGRPQNPSASFSGAGGLPAGNMDSFGQEWLMRKLTDNQGL